MSTNRLTQSPLVHLFRRESENRYEFCQYFDKNPGHRRGGSIDVGVNHESSNKALYAFKNFDEGIVASFHGLGSLVIPDIRTEGSVERACRIRTDRRTLMAEKIGDAGGNAYMTRVLKKTVRHKRTLWGSQD